MVDFERARGLTDDERHELDTYVYLNHLLILLKAEARLQMRQPSDQGK